MLRTSSAARSFWLKKCRGIKRAPGKMRAERVEPVKRRIGKRRIIAPCLRAESLAYIQCDLFKGAGGRDGGCTGDRLRGQCYPSLRAAWNPGRTARDRAAHERSARSPP